MFEKEAEEYALVSLPDGYTKIDHQKKVDFQKGAEFGYNKANEWHDLQKDPNDLPKENMKQVMVITNYNECLMGWYCIHQKTWYSSDCPDPQDKIETDGTKVVMWKEIVLPELKENE